MKNLNIRKPTLAGVEGLVKLIDQLGYSIGDDEMKRNLFKYLSLKNQDVWIAEIDEKIVGCIAVAITNYFHSESSFLRIIMMVVDKKYRRKGIGSKLMKTMEGYAIDMHSSHIEVSSGIHRKEMGFHEFYKHLGYIDLNKHKKYFGKKL